jgi:hypothetical protein
VEQSWEMAVKDAEARETIYRLVRDIYPLAKLTHEINHHISAFLLAIEGELPVAFASYKFGPVDVRACEIISLYCLPQTQGKRIDELLIEEVIKNTIAAGGQKIRAILNYNGPVSLFERMGFEPLKLNDPEFDSDILIMSKILEMPKSN